MKKLLVSIVALGLCTLAAQAQNALTFSRIDRDPVLAGTAGASVASTGTMAWSAFHNAAVIPFVASEFDAAVSYQFWSPQMAKASHVNAGLAYRFKGKAGLSLGFAYQGGEKFDDFVPKDLLACVGFGIGLGDKFSLGVNARFASQMLAQDISFTGFSGDVSLLFHAADALNLLAGVGTLGTSVVSSSGTKFPQPAFGQLGVDYTFALGKEMALKADACAEYYFSGSFAAAAGLQFDWTFLSARAGYRFATEGCVLPSHLALGLGARFGGFRVDVSYLTASTSLGNTLTAGLGYSF